MKQETRSLLFRVITPFFALLAIFLVAGLRFAEPVWLLDRGVFLMAGMVAGSYLIGHIILLLPIARSRQFFMHVLRVVAVAVLVSLPVLFYLLIMDINVSRLVIVYELGLLFLLLTTNSFSSRPGFVLIGNALILGVIIYASFFSISQNTTASGEKVEFDNSVSYELANYHDIKITKYKLFNSEELANGGSIEAIDATRLLLATGYGSMYLIDTIGDELDVQKLNIRVSINADTYLSEAQNPTQYFRVTDILLEDTESSVRKLYAAHHYFDTVKQCFTLRLSETQVDLQNFQIGEWSTRYDTELGNSI